MISCMDRASLEQFLGDGLSLAEIGQRVGRHEATVGYWIKKYGLEAANQGKHEAKGGLLREDLTRLVDAGMSIAQIADAVGRSKATVRHWLARYGLKTHGALGRRVRVQALAAKQAGLEVTVLECRHHGSTAFVLDQRATTAVSDVAPRRSPGDAGGSRICSSLRPGAPVAFAVTAATPGHCTSTTWTRR